MSLDARVYSSPNASSRPSNPLREGVHKDVHTALHKFLLVTSQPDTHVWQTAAIFKTQQRPQSSFPMSVHESRKSLHHLPSSAPLPFLCRKKLRGYDEKKKLSIKVAQPQFWYTSPVCGSPSHLIQSQSLRLLKEKWNTIPRVSTCKRRPSASMLAL